MSELSAENRYFLYMFIAYYSKEVRSS